MNINRSKNSYFLTVIAIILLSVIDTAAYAQAAAPSDLVKRDSLGIKKVKGHNATDNTTRQYDFSDFTRNILHPGRTADPENNRSGLTVVPNLSANPTVGFQVGIKAVAGKKLGNDPKTLLSVAATSASITTKGIIYFYINHNIFTPGNNYNLQGNIVIAKTLSPDYGIGIGRDFRGTSAADRVLADPDHKAHGIDSYFLNIREKVYKKVAKDLFVGAGLSFDVRRKIAQRDTAAITPSSVYDARHGFPLDHYSADGFLFNVEYTTRDNQNRAYKGIYIDGGIRVNQSWIGSTKDAVQLTTDFRKYFSLSTQNPEHVLAFWNWGSYLLSGNIPYLELPGTARDGAFRGGRGYTTQYFKGTQYNDTEAEYRFPISKNKFLSGVVFANAQTANDEQGTKLFQVFQPGYGAGLRVLFNKATRTNLALDYAFGKFGNKGFFLNLNEAF